MRAGATTLAKGLAAGVLALALSCPARSDEPMRGHGGPVRALAVRDGREVVSGSFDSSVIVWDLRQGSATRVLRFHDGAVNAVATLSDGCFASGGEDRRIAVWCGAGETPKLVLPGHDGPVTSLAPYRGGGTFVSASFDCTVREWGAGDGSNVQPRLLTTFPAAATALATIPGGELVAAGAADGSLRVILPGEDNPRATAMLPGPVTALAMTADGEIIAASADGHVRLFTLALQPLADVEIDGVALASLALSPDARLFATAGLRGGIAVIDRASRRVLHRLTGPGLPVWSLAFERDSRTLLSGGADRTIRRWDAVAGTALTSTVPEPLEAAPTERGAIVFRACRACHTLGADDGPRAGPTLHGVMGRRIGSAPGYPYSDALKRLEIVWSPDTIDRLFEVGPATYTPGTKMPEQTISDPVDRTALVEWLARATR